MEKENNEQAEAILAEDVEVGDRIVHSVDMGRMSPVVVLEILSGNESLDFVYDTSGRGRTIAATFGETIYRYTE